MYIELPPVKVSGNQLLEAIWRRRSIRKYSSKPLTLKQLSVILWAAYGCRDRYCDERNVPSAGGIYPVKIYIVVGRNGVEGLDAGVYQYDEERHGLVEARSGDYRVDLYYACLEQEWVRDAPVSIVIVADPKPTFLVYRDRAERYIFQESGHIGQNIYLVSTMLGLGTVAVGAFYDDEVKKIVGVPREYMALYVMPVGYSGE